MYILPHLILGAIIGVGVRWAGWIYGFTDGEISVHIILTVLIGSLFISYIQEKRNV